MEAARHTWHLTPTWQAHSRHLLYKWVQQGSRDHAEPTWVPHLLRKKSETKDTPGTRRDTRGHAGTRGDAPGTRRDKEPQERRAKEQKRLQVVSHFRLENK